MNVTIRAPEETVDEWDDEADARGMSRNQYLLEMIERGRDYERLESEHEDEIRHLEARIDDLQRQLRESNKRNDEVTELVEYVDSQRSYERQYRTAGLLTRAKWKLTGMPDPEDENDE